jgi:hypothetical protein
MQWLIFKKRCPKLLNGAMDTKWVNSSAIRGFCQARIGEETPSWYNEIDRYVRGHYTA